ncbi:MAG: hypothetical protein LC770_12565 [Acidobacteria bacterium]|nr:hypothetical protein [Acidobacteriota bacterium]
MNKALTFGAELGIGTGMMYLLDPDRGKRRRALLRDTCVSATRKTGEGIETTPRDLSNRARGIAIQERPQQPSHRACDRCCSPAVHRRAGHPES